jgi:hypothetical protein
VEPKKEKTVIPRVRLSDLKKRNELRASVTPTIIDAETVKSIEQDLKVKTKKDVNWIRYSDLEFTDLLGSGTSGDVYRGYYAREEVAIKVLEKERENKLEEFKHEFKVMRYGVRSKRYSHVNSAIRGDHIVTFHGACLEPKPCLVMEFCGRGSVYDVLNDRKVEFSWRELLRFAMEMAHALDTLHNNDPQILVGNCDVLANS